MILFNMTKTQMKNNCGRLPFPRTRLAIGRSTLLLWVGLALVVLAALARADVLISINGERFVGTIIEETTNTVLFQSHLGGRLPVPRTAIRELQRTLPVEVKNSDQTSVVSTNARAREAAKNHLSWKPPGVGHDGSDWLQLKSSEWLRGEIKYIQDKEVEFDSDELDMQTLKLKDVRQIYPAHPMYVKFDDRKPVYGNVIISNDVVSVIGTEPVKLNRDQLIGLTPSGGRTGIRNWSGNFVVGLSLQSGNNSQTTLSTSAGLARRTPNTRLLLDYLGNYSKVNNVENVNNDRVNLTYDIRFSRDWFVRPVQWEYYHDPLANISYRLTAGVGGGYYLFDRTGLEWTVAAGPAYQYTKFDTVEAGQPDTAKTPAAGIETYFKADLTSRLTFIENWQSTVTSKEAGQYTHHAVSTLEFEIKRHLNLDVSFVWDYLQNPQTKSDGSVPQKSDTYLTVGLGVRF